MTTDDLSLLRDAALLLKALAYSDDWYDETPKDGGPDVIAWRGKQDPEELARVARQKVEAVISRYIGWPGQAGRTL